MTPWLLCRRHLRSLRASKRTMKVSEFFFVFHPFSFFLCLSGFLTCNLVRSALRRNKKQLLDDMEVRDSPI
jgi:hypothetical protein